MRRSIWRATRSGRRGSPNIPVGRLSNVQPRSASSVPAGSFGKKSAPITPTEPVSWRHSTLLSAPIVRSSWPIQELIADGVRVHGLVQPIALVFERDRRKERAAFEAQQPGPGSNRLVAGIGFEDVERHVQSGATPQRREGDERRHQLRPDIGERLADGQRLTVAAAEFELAEPALLE